MGERGRIKKSYRFPQDVVRELREIADTLGISETEAICRAIHSFYLSLKGEEQGAVSGAIVPFSEYQKTQERLSQALYKIGELEGRLSEKEELISELRNRIKELQAKPSRKWWKFWKSDK